MLTIYNRQKIEVGGIQTFGHRAEAGSVQIRKRINAENELQFMMAMDSDKYPLIQEEGLIECQGQLYIIKSRERRREGMGKLVTITCPHVMRRLMDIRVPYEAAIEEKLGCDISYLTNILSAATNGRFTFQLMDVIDPKDVYNWGFSNCLKALQDLVNLYEVEFVPDNYNIKIYKKISIDNGREYRYARNIISDAFETNTNALVTRMTGLAKDSLTIIGLPASHLTEAERNMLNLISGAIVGGIIKVPYLISQYAASWATPDNAYFDGEFEDTDIEADTEAGKLQLLKEIRKKLKEQEVPDMQIKVSPVDVHKKAGSGEAAPQLGETVYLIDGGMELDDIAARIVEMTEYPFDLSKSGELTIANYILRDMNQIIADLDASKNYIENLFSKGTLNRSALDAFLREAVQDVINSKTEIIYPDDGGLLLQNKDNALEQVYMKAKGIVISQDGGQTAKTAITGKGIGAEYIVGILGEFAQVKTDNLIAGNAKIGSALIDKIQANQIDVATGKITAAQIDATHLQVQAANITGQLTAAQINATNLQVAAANITGKLTSGQIDVTGLYVGTGGIQISPTASIGWGLIKDQPSNIYNPSYLQSTYIGATNIFSPAISGGSISIGNGNFEVDSAGNVSARSGNFNGTLKTAPSGTRVEMSSNFADINLYNGPLNILAIRDQANGNVTMHNPSGNSLGIGNGVTGRVNAYGTWNFSSASVTGLSIPAKFS